VFVLVAEQAGAGIVGFGAGGPEREGDPVYQGELYGLYLLPAYQRQGLGWRLMVAAARELIARGFGAMLVWVLRANAGGRAFYEGLGGTLLREGTFEKDGLTLPKVAYSWRDLTGPASGADSE
jgi:ribosomal protein S18 acetylase RimI-like enzyme